MTYIILDLEWNQPISYQSRTYREVGDKLSDLVVELKGLNFNQDEKKGLKNLFKKSTNNSLKYKS